jgi:mRNA interferase RelE/StbE
MNGTRYSIEYGEIALNDLKTIPPVHRTQILNKIERLQSGLHGDIKRLRAADTAYRLRMGVYRILFDVVGNLIIIQRVRHRKEAYD